MARHLKISAAVLSWTHHLIGVDTGFSADHSYAVGCLQKINKDNFPISPGSVKNIFLLFEFSFTWVFFLCWGRDCCWGAVGECMCRPPWWRGLSLTVSFLGLINGFLPHLAVNLRPKEFLGPPNARNVAWLMKGGGHNAVSSFLETTLQWAIVATKLKQCTGLSHHPSYFPWFSRIFRHFAIWITKRYLCIFWWRVTATVYSQKLKLTLLRNWLSPLHV